MKPKHLMTPKSFIFMLLCAWAALAISSCSRSPADATPERSGGKGKPVAVKVEPVRSQPVARVFEITGEVVAANTVALAATVEGPISFCPLREGDRVERGQKLIEIDRPLYREEVAAAAAALAVARAKLDDLKAGSRPEEIAQAEETVKKLQAAVAFARTDLERIAELVSKGGFPAESQQKAQVTLVDLQSQLASAQQRHEMLRAGPTRTAIAVQQALVKEAQTKLKLAQAKLAEGTISAPFAGIVTKVHVRRGDLAAVKSPLVELYDPSSLVIRFAVPEAESGADFSAMAIQVGLDAYPGKSFRAKVVRLYPEIDRKTRNRLAEAGVLDLVNLAPGMFARIKVQLETAPDALVVPSESIMAASGGAQTVVMVREGKAVHVKVSTGIVQNDRTQILSGLQAGDPVVVLGQEGLKDGTPVKIAAEGKPGGEAGQKGEAKPGRKGTGRKGGGNQ